ncbi:hypothetical protein ATY37_19960 [Vibrio cidicii]|uniref:Uncharacterized protein n=1 Tax=Vibrio cidicii TaxID=1763883 RepID=A0A151KUQ3_9VIBR|nr:MULTISPECIES: hypothetical protein [Vibrio]ELP1876838.1 hypothetical protein [Vibrio vulnificus]EKF9738651.1 hypothetical protein [Vibrio cholerae]KYN85390.1 hypothetical protein ATY37_19960 [Vibrio cidicii]TXX99539.1 hypothetical protein FXF02_09470 [Vibrio cholerae]GIA89532.1 hypothetical protein VCSRO134_3382 [Vibrio cholerae]
MGIGSNYYVEVAEEEYREALREEIARDAAVFVVEGIDRASSLKAAREIIEAQQEAISSGAYDEDENGVIRFHDSSIESPVTPLGKESQVNAIAAELIDSID